MDQWYIVTLGYHWGDLECIVSLCGVDVDDLYQWEGRRLRCYCFRDRCALHDSGDGPVLKSVWHLPEDYNGDGVNHEVITQVLRFIHTGS